MTGIEIVLLVWLVLGGVVAFFAFLNFMYEASMYRSEGGDSHRQEARVSAIVAVLAPVWLLVVPIVLVYYTGKNIRSVFVGEKK